MLIANGSSTNKVYTAGDTVWYGGYNDPFTVYGYTDDNIELVLHGTFDGWKFADPSLVRPY